MALHDVLLPKTGLNTDDVILVEWLVEEGGEVANGDVVLIMETNKVEVEVEVEHSGFLRHLLAPDAEVPVGTTAGIIAETQEEYVQLLDGQ